MRNEIARPPIFSGGKSANQFGGKPKFFLISIFFLVFSFFFSPLTTHHSPFTNEVYAALSCDTCHKGPPYGPDYTSVPADKKYNSHIKHTTAPFSYGCEICHIEVTTGPWTATGAGYTIIFATNHANGVYNVKPKSSDYNFTYSTNYAVGQSTCATIKCHGGNTAFWGGSVSCYDCHASTTDVDDYTFLNGVTATISTHSVVGWFGTGHGRITGNYESGRPPANFGGKDGCKYCHDGTNYNHDYSTGPNFFRLANSTQTKYDAFGDSQNGNCLVCHSTVTPGGYAPPGMSAKNATVTKSTFTFHVAGKQGVEGTNTDGGRYCWDCHDPHGDWSLVYPSTLAYMIQARPVELTAGTTGPPNTSYGVPASVVTVSSFTIKMGTSAVVFDYFDYVVASSSGICQTCHDTTVNYFNKGSYLTSHNPGSRCTSCHEHKNYFIGKGECISCHDGVAGTRRAIKGEFNQTWTHMRSSTPTAKTVKNEDCAICHMEGDSAGKTTSYHKDGATSTPVGDFAGMIQLRNPDTNATILFSTWSGRIAGIAGSTWTSGSYKDWSVDRTGYLYKVVAGSFSFVRFERKTSTNVLEAWVTSIQNNLCLKCHDETGGAKVDPGDPTRPFSSSTGVVVNVSSHLATTNASFHPVRGPQNNPYCDKDSMLPPWNQFTKRSTPTVTITGAAETGGLISCWDCHIATATAHGGAATLRATYYEVTMNTFTKLCVLCHRQTVYWNTAAVEPIGLTAFDGSKGADYSHINTHADQSRHEPGEGTSYFYGCRPCHGSATGDGAATGGAANTRTRRAQDVHGFNTLTTGAGNWALSTSARPFAFLRNTESGTTAAITDWRPERVSGTVLGASKCIANCGASARTGHTGTDPEAYEPGGTY